MGELIIRRDGPVGRVVFSNPAKYNAMSYDMWMALPRALKDFDADPSIRLVVLEGDGTKAFVSGADISQFESRRSDADGQASYNRAVEMAYLSPIACSKPVIAKIRGICMGGGLGLAAACDIRFCSDDARFRMPAARLGLGYNSIGVRRFLDVFGLQNTLDIFYTARIFGAADALKMGFVSRVETPAALDSVVDEWCAMVAANAPLTLKALKLTVNELGRDAAERDMAAVDIQISKNSQQVVTAPRDGIVLSVSATDGSYLEPGSLICVVIPDTSERFVEAWIDGMDMPLVTPRSTAPDGTVIPGSRARLQFEGWPAIQLIGWPSLAVGTFGGEVITVDATDDGSGRFRIVVAADAADMAWPGGQFLRQGVRAKAWVMLNRVPAWREVWRQLNGFPPISIEGIEPAGKDRDPKKKKPKSSKEG